MIQYFNHVRSKATLKLRATFSLMTLKHDLRKTSATMGTPFEMFLIFFFRIPLKTYLEDVVKFLRVLIHIFNNSIVSRKPPGLGLRDPGHNSTDHIPLPNSRKVEKRTSCSKLAYYHLVEYLIWKKKKNMVHHSSITEKLPPFSVNWIYLVIDKRCHFYVIIKI